MSGSVPGHGLSATTGNGTNRIIGKPGISYERKSWIIGLRAGSADWTPCASHESAAVSIRVARTRAAHDHIPRPRACAATTRAGRKSPTHRAHGTGIPYSSIIP